MKAIIFDLDGTLVQTEILKASSYAKAATALRPGSLEEDEVIEAFKEVVGLSRSEVAKAILHKNKLERRGAWYGLLTWEGRTSRLRAFC